MDTSKKTLTCERAQDLMFLYIEGELNARDTARLSAHLDGCEACRKELEERKHILKSLGKCELVPPSSLKSGIMDKINTVPQERTHPMRRFIPIGAISGVAAAVMIFAVCRVFVFGGAVNDMAFDNAKSAADCEAGLTVGNSAPTEACEVNTVYGGANIGEDAVHFVADMADGIADIADGAAAEPETAAPEKAEVYAVTSSIVAFSPGVGLITEPKYDYSANSAVKTQTTAAPEAGDKALAASTASPTDKLFEKLRTNDRAIIVCRSFDGTVAEKADAEEIITVDGTEFVHMTFSENADVLYSHILDTLETEGVYYCAAAPEGEYEYFELLFGIDSEK